MSTRIGTFEPRARIGYPVWLAGLLAALMAVTLAFAAVTVVRDRGDEAARVSGAHGTAANTPTELSGGVIGRIEPGLVADAARWQAQAGAHLAGRVADAARWQAQAGAHLAGRVADAARWQAQAGAHLAGRVADAARWQAQADANSAAQTGDDAATGRRGVTPRVADAEPVEIVVNGEICHQCQ